MTQPRLLDVPTSEVGYTSATAWGEGGGGEDHEVWEDLWWHWKKKNKLIFWLHDSFSRAQIQGNNLHILKIVRINLLKHKILGTTSFNIQKFCVLPTILVCFACISEQTAIISLYIIKFSVFITEAESVYSAVRTGSLTETDIVSSLKD